MNVITHIRATNIKNNPPPPPPQKKEINKPLTNKHTNQLTKKIQTRTSELLLLS